MGDGNRQCRSLPVAWSIVTKNVGVCVMLIENVGVHL